MKQHLQRDGSRSVMCVSQCLVSHDQEIQHRQIWPFTSCTCKYLPIFSPGLLTTPVRPPTPLQPLLFEAFKARMNSSACPLVSRGCRASWESLIKYSHYYYYCYFIHNACMLFSIENHMFIVFIHDFIITCKGLLFILG